MLRKSLLAVGLLALIGGTAQASSSLELKDVMGLSVAEEPVGKLCSLRIRGLSGHSAMMIERTTVERSGRTNQVNIELALVRNGGSGNFDVALNIDASVDEVVFGKERAVVWRRGNSKCVANLH